MLEHEAFKGSRRVGTLDWQQEAPLLAAQDEGKVSQSPDNKCSSRDNMCRLQKKVCCISCWQLPSENEDQAVVEEVGEGIN